MRKAILCKYEIQNRGLREPQSPLTNRELLHTMVLRSFGTSPSAALEIQIHCKYKNVNFKFQI